jgi:anhydro-N-acetylmuramic acid kinase
MKKKKSVKGESIVLGIMSGTSLDGLDLALCAFSGETRYDYRILKAKTVRYPAIWKQRLTSSSTGSSEKYFAMDVLYGQYIASQVTEFLDGSRRRPVAIASHGHTIFHQPHAGFTTQMGNGAVIAARTGITTVCDFRSLDVALKGQGAPLVPIGDKLLFGDHQACLNLGGIANISFDRKGQRIAYDICAANMLLNYLAETLGHEYDEDGTLARAGAVNKALLEKLNALDYYRKGGAKSMGREWFEKNLLNTFERSPLTAQDKLATATEHIAAVIAADLNREKIGNVIVTGGGAFNGLLISLLRAKCKAEVVLPSAEIINFKEALIFAFLGYLRLKKRINTLASVTGASRDSIGGAVYRGD